MNRKKKPFTVKQQQLISSVAYRYLEQYRQAALTMNKRDFVRHFLSTARLDGFDRTIAGAMAYRLFSIVHIRRKEALKAAPPVPAASTWRHLEKQAVKGEDGITRYPEAPRKDLLAPAGGKRPKGVGHRGRGFGSTNRPAV